MRIGVGLPTSTPPLGARHRGSELLAWSARAEAGPFTSLGVTDRLVYDCTDPLVALAAAAAVTTRLRLVTMVVIGPVRPAAVLAAQAASLDALSGGRLTLGVSLGARPDDYDAAGASWRSRGRALSDELAAMRESLEELKQRLVQIESHVTDNTFQGARAALSNEQASAQQQHQSSTMNGARSPWLSGMYVPATHPSQERFGVEEAAVSELVDFFEKEKKCEIEPGGKPCDHCAMCSTRGF